MHGGTKGCRWDMTRESDTGSAWSGLLCNISLVRSRLPCGRDGEHPRSQVAVWPGDLPWFWRTGPAVGPTGRQPQWKEAHSYLDKAERPADVTAPSSSTRGSSRATRPPPICSRSFTRARRAAAGRHAAGTRGCGAEPTARQAHRLEGTPPNPPPSPRAPQRSRLVTSPCTPARGGPWCRAGSTVKAVVKQARDVPGAHGPNLGRRQGLQPAGRPAAPERAAAAKEPEGCRQAGRAAAASVDATSESGLASRGRPNSD